MSNQCRPIGCPMTMTLEVIGGKWKGIILYHLVDGKKRFNELMRLIPDVTQRMLTRQLRELEEDGVIIRKVYAEVPPKVEYFMSDLGMTLVPVIHTLSTWGKTYHQLHGVPTRHKYEVDVLGSNGGVTINA